MWASKFWQYPLLLEQRQQKSVQSHRLSQCVTTTWVLEDWRRQLVAPTACCTELTWDSRENHLAHSAPDQSCVPMPYYNNPSKALHICCGFRAGAEEVPVRAMSRSADHFASWCPFHGIWVLVMVMWCNPWQDLLVILSHWLPEWETEMLISKTEIEQLTWLLMNSTIHTKCILCYSGCPLLDQFLTRSSSYLL